MQYCSEINLLPDIQYITDLKKIKTCSYFFAGLPTE